MIYYITTIFQKFQKLWLKQIKIVSIKIFSNGDTLIKAMTTISTTVGGGDVVWKYMDHGG